MIKEMKKMKNISYALEGTNIVKKFKEFELNIPKLKIPRGFATALIGENGAGKTTLLNCLAGIRLDYKGEINYFGKYTDKDREKDPTVKEKLGYQGSGDYYIPTWSIKQVSEMSSMLFSEFDPAAFKEWCTKLDIISGDDMSKSVNSLSDGNKVKLMLSGILARDTELMLLDEPASPLDPLMRDTLCEILRDYLEKGDGQRSVFFSTHNIADMEQITDYAIIMEKGSIVEEGFVTDLKEKYVLVKGDAEYSEQAKKSMFSIQTGSMGFEGIILSERLDELAGMKIVTEAPSLSQIAVAVMKQYSRIKL